MSAVQSSAVIIIFFLSCSSAMDQHQLELQRNYEHVAYIASFPCHHPRPKVISVEELFSKDQCHGKAYYPDVTVLHRCECTGSCPSGHACSAKTTKLALLPFKVTYLDDMRGFKKGSWQMEYHELLNHTECACAVPPPHDSYLSNIVNSFVQEQSSTPSVLDTVGGRSTSRHDDSSSGSSSDNDFSTSTTESNTAESTTLDYIADLLSGYGQGS